MSSFPSEEEWREALITLSQFVYLGEKGFIRENIHGNVIEITLFLNKDKEPISFQELQTLLTESLWKTTLPLPKIEETCMSLQKENRIGVKANRVNLTGERRKEIEKEVETVASEKKSIEKIFIDKLYGQYKVTADLGLTEADQVLCIRLFWKYLSRLLSFKASTVGQLLRSSNFKIDTSISNALFVNL